MDNNKTIENRRKFIINFLYYAIILGCIIIFMRYLIYFIMPFFIAFVISLILRPLVRWSTKKLKISRNIASAFWVILFYMTIGVLAVIFFINLFSFTQNLILKIPSYFTNDMLPVLTKWGSNFDKLADKYNVEYDISSILTTVGGKLSSLSTSIVSFTGNVAVSVPGFIVNLIICVMSTYFFTADLTLFKEFIYKQLSGKAVNIIDNAVRLFFVNIGRYVKSYALIVVITFCELFISFLIIGIKGSFYIAMIIAIFDILPIVGCGTILLPWLVYAIVKGNSSLAIGLAIVYIIVTIVRNIIEPRIVGKQVGLHPLLTLAGMIVGTYVFGLLGLLGLPIALTIIKDLNEQEIIHLYRP